MKQIHKALIKKGGLYADWHKHGAHGLVHFMVFVAVSTLFTGNIIDGINKLYNFNVPISTYEFFASAQTESGQEKNILDIENIATDTPRLASSNSFLIRIKASSQPYVKPVPTALNTGMASINRLNQTYGIADFKPATKPNRNSIKSAAVFRWYTVKLPGTAGIIDLREDSVDSRKIKKLMQAYETSPSVEFIQPNYKIYADAVPNDSYYPTAGAWGQDYKDMWGLHTIGAAEAWDQTTGSEIIVASIDSGVDRNHPDLAGNMWVNSKEIPGNARDDDYNGYVDDYYGWNFVKNNSDPMDDHGHGTHTAGTIAAFGNNGIGVVGVNWKAKIMALKFLGADGSGDTRSALAALQYAVDNGAKVSNNSWGGMQQNPALDDMIRYAHDKGMVVVAAAGNSKKDALSFSPAMADDAITVSASDWDDLRASFSNFGEKIDVAAPGVNILSLKSAVSPMCATKTVGGNYCYVSGTSMAAPHVAGLAALILSKNQSLTPEEVRQIIRSGAVDKGAVGKDDDFGFGRISAVGSLTMATVKPLSPYISFPKSRIGISGPAFQIMGSIGGEYKSYKIEFRESRSSTPWTLLTTSDQPIANGILATVDTTTLGEDRKISIKLTAYDAAGKSYEYQVFDVPIDNFDANITSPQIQVSKGMISIIGSAQTKAGLTFSSYKLERKAGAPALGGSGGEWTSQGITLANGGTQPVVNGLLGTWNTTNYGELIYSLRLTVEATNGGKAQKTISVEVDPDLLSGWPKSFPNPFVLSPAAVMPAAGDIDGDGRKEVVVNAKDGIHAIKIDGTEAAGFPVLLDGYSTIDDSMATLSDLDGDKKMEILAAVANSYSIPYGPKKLLILKGNGTSYPGWTKPSINIFASAVSGMTTADLNGDGKKEILIIENPTSTLLTKNLLHAYQLNGTELAGFPKSFTKINDNSHYLNSAVSVLDLDKNGKNYISFGVQNYVYLLNSIGQTLEGWPKIVPELTTSGKKLTFNIVPVSADIDGDGEREIFAFGHHPSRDDKEGFMYGWKKSGELVANFPVKILNNDTDETLALSVSDVDNDGKEEVVIGLNSLYVFGESGLEKEISDSFASKGAVSISDINGNGFSEFSITHLSSVELSPWDNVGSFYKLLDPSINGVVGGYFEPPIVTDLDGDGRMELVASHVNALYSGSVTTFAWKIPVATLSAKWDWPMFAHDAARSGLQTMVVGSSTSTVCASFSYSAWGVCQNGVQTRTILSASPAGCTGGSAITSRSCSSPICTYTYSAWSTCQNGNQTRTVLSSLPAGCTGTPETTRACDEPLTCTVFTYSPWGECVNGVKKRTVISASPAGCTGGNPVISENCTTTPSTCAYTYSVWSTCQNGMQTRTVLSAEPPGCTGTPEISKSCTVTCTSFTYSEWSICTNGVQTRKILSSLPSGCVGGSPSLSRSCVQCSYAYSPWGTCVNGVKSRSVLSSSPAGCVGTPITSMSCTSTPCVYTYSAWGGCKPDGTQTRTALSSTPAGCTGTPQLSQNCTYTPTSTNSIILLSPTSLTFTAVKNVRPSSKSLSIYNSVNTGTSGSVLKMAGKTDKTWCRVTFGNYPLSEWFSVPIGLGLPVNVSVDPMANAGTYSCKVTIYGTALNSPQIAEVTYNVTN